jgi:hypothetical protein
MVEFLQIAHLDLLGFRQSFYGVSILKSGAALGRRVALFIAYFARGG